MAKRFSAFLATSGPVPGRSRTLSEDDIRSLAGSLTPGEPLTWNHDDRTHVDARIVAADLRRTPDDELGLWVEVEVDDQVFEALPDRFGFSVGFGREDFPLDPESDLPTIQLAVDSENFSEDDLVGALTALQANFNVSAGWFDQYSELPPPVVIIGLGLMFVQTIAPEVLKSVLVEAIKDRLFHPRSGRPTLFHVHLKSTDREIRAHIETSDPDVFREAAGLLRDLVGREGEAFDFLPGENDWKRIR